MPVILKQVMPDNVSLEILDAVTDEMSADSNPPAGLILHTHYKEGGRVHVFDLWETEADYQAFAEQRLGPAMGKVVAQHGITPPAASEQPTISQAHRVVRGR